MPVEHLGLNPESVLLSFDKGKCQEQPAVDLTSTKSALYGHRAIPPRPDLMDEDYGAISDKISKMETKEKLFKTQKI